MTRHKEKVAKGSHFSMSMLSYHHLSQPPPPDSNAPHTLTPGHFTALPCCCGHSTVASEMSSEPAQWQCPLPWQWRGEERRTQASFRWLPTALYSQRYGWLSCASLLPASFSHAAFTHSWGVLSLGVKHIRFPLGCISALEILEEK